VILFFCDRTVQIISTFIQGVRMIILLKASIILIFSGLFAIGCGSKKVSINKTTDLSPMVLINAGEFRMGSNEQDNEKPIHNVYLDAYYIDRYEVAHKDYRKCVIAGVCATPKTGQYNNWGNTDRYRHPINGVSWSDAKKYCEFVNMRLPTEAEWEKAATWKNGQKFRYPAGKNSVSCQDAVIIDKATFLDYDTNGGCNRISTWQVGSKSQEINGTYDMAGNVREWVADKYDKSYYSSNDSMKNPKGPAQGSSWVVRGGGWGSEAEDVRGTVRGYNNPSDPDQGFGPENFSGFGFRCASSH